MSKDDRKLVAKLLDQHRAIEGQARQVRGSMADHEARASLEIARFDWTPGRFGSVSEKQERLREEFERLEEGLKRHFQFEEKVLPSLLGGPLMRALTLQHREIQAEIADARSVVAEADLEGLEREDLLVQESRVQQRVSVVLRLVEEHATREELILEMIETGLADAD